MSYPMSPWTAGRNPGLPVPLWNCSSSSSVRSFSGCSQSPLKLAWRNRGRRIPRSCSRTRSGAAPVAIRAAVSAGRRRSRALVTPAAETSTSFSNRSGWATAASAEMKPPIELPTNAHLPIPTASQNR